MIFDVSNQTLNATTKTRGEHNDTNLQFDWKPYDDASAIIQYAMFLAIVVLNGYVIVTCHTKVKSKTRLHFFMVHLAYADFLVGAFTVLGDAIDGSLYGRWYGGDIFCRIYRFLNILFICASNNLLIGMSVDRFIAIRFPMKAVKIGNKLNRIFVLGAWIISALMGVMYIPFTKGDELRCENNFPPDMRKPFITILAITVYVLPTIAIIFCYTGISVILWQKWRENSSLTELNDDQDINSGYLPRAKIKSIKVTLVICIAFFICWTPHFLSVMFSLYEYHPFGPGWSMLIGMLYPLNSITNPVVFIIFNIDIFCDLRRERIQTATEENDTQPMAF